jgi:hypothetical protein
MGKKRSQRNERARQSPRGDEQARAQAPAAKASAAKAPGVVAAPPSGARLSAASRGLLAFVAGAFLLFLLGIAALRVSASSYLSSLPENYAGRARAALSKGDASGAMAAIDAELSLRPYNFEARHDFAELALHPPVGGTLAAPALAELRRAALTRLFNGFEAFQAIGARDVHASSWSEGAALSDIARLLAALGSEDGAWRAWSAAEQADPAWTPSRRAAWAKREPTLAGRVEQLERILDIMEGGEGVLCPTPPPPPLPSTPIFDSAALGLDTFLPSASDVRGRMVEDPAAPQGKAFLLFRRGTFDLASLAPSPPGGASSPSAKAATLSAWIRGAPAFGGWPFLLVEAERPGSPRREALGFLLASSDGKWRQATTRLVRPLEEGERLVLSYWNDAYDEERKEDRNLLVASLALGE